jgi:hypothetical protein
VIRSREARIPLVQNVGWGQVAPFFDYGRARRSKAARKNRATSSAFASAFALPPHVTLGVSRAIPIRSLPGGHALQDIETSGTGKNLQDHGIHFQFLLGFF